MILDELTEFCDATALNTGAAGTYVLGDQIDLQVVRDLGGDQALYLVIGAAVGINAAGAGTVQFALTSADDAALTTNPVNHVLSPAYVTSTTSGNAGGALAAGKRLLTVPLPHEGDVPYKRYVGIRQITGAQAITAGAIDAFLTVNPNAWKSYDAPWQL